LDRRISAYDVPVEGKLPTTYTKAERRRQALWKRSWAELPAAARAPGSWKNTPCGFILLVAHAPLNLWPPIRDEIVAYFLAHDVAWHDGETDDYGVRNESGPSPHLLDSQVCALNFWWGLGRSPAALAEALRSIFVDLDVVVALKAREPLVAPEWIGLRNYLAVEAFVKRVGSPSYKIQPDV
jgi:hypothetical protein